MMNPPAKESYLTAGALKSKLGLTDGEIRKVRAAAGKGLVRSRQSQYCRTDKTYNMADVRALLNIPKEQPPTQCANLPKS